MIWICVAFHSLTGISGHDENMSVCFISVITTVIISMWCGYERARLAIWWQDSNNHKVTMEKEYALKYNLILIMIITWKSKFPYYKIKKLLSNHPWNQPFRVIVFLASFFFLFWLLEKKPNPILILKLRLPDS